VERRRATGRPREVPLDLPSLADVAPDDVGRSALVVSAALATLMAGNDSPAVRGLWERLAAALADDRTAVLARLRAPNPYHLATVGGRRI
jgi:hypothetical protein